MESWRHPKIDKKKNRSIGNSLYEKTTRIFAIKNFTIEFSLPTHRTPKSDLFEIVASVGIKSRYRSELLRLIYAEPPPLSATAWNRRGLRRFDGLDAC